MALSRYSKTEEVENTDIDYKKAFKSRFGLSEKIVQLRKANLQFPDFEEYNSMAFKFEIWGMGSRLHKFSEKYYNSPNYWWVIAWYNKKPTEADYSLGEVVRIPVPLETALENMGY